ncbi:MAG: tripartite tricarboxylate transporter TctB family protein [Syntrophales bacterium]
MNIKNGKDFYTGLLFMLFGGGFMWGALQYDLGTAARMGAGYFPLILGGILSFLGVVVFLRSLVIGAPDSTIGRIAIVPMLMMFGAIAAFAVLLRGAGLVVSILAIILISSLASRESRLMETLISAVVLCTASVLLFVYALNLQIPVWPFFIRR